MSSPFFLWALTGGDLSIAFMMHFWLPDPPPPLPLGQAHRYRDRWRIRRSLWGLGCSWCLLRERSDACYRCSWRSGLIVSGLAAAFTTVRRNIAR